MSDVRLKCVYRTCCYGRNKHEFKYSVLLCDVHVSASIRDDVIIITFGCLNECLYHRSLLSEKEKPMTLLTGAGSSEEKKMFLKPVGWILIWQHSAFTTQHEAQTSSHICT